MSGSHYFRNDYKVIRITDIRVFCFLLLGIVFFIAGGAPAYAQSSESILGGDVTVGCETGAQAMPDGDCLEGTAPQHHESRVLSKLCPDREGLVNKIVPCFTQIIINATHFFIQEIYPPLESAIYAFLTLAIILFGVKMVAGMLEKASRDAFVVLIKIAAVIFFTANLEWVYDSMLGALDDLLLSVSQAAIFNDQLKCDFGLPLWERVDCTLNVVIGISSPRLLSDGMLGFFFHSVWHGSIGMAIGLLGIWMTINLGLGILKAIQTYLLAIMMLSLTMVVGVLFVPFILFLTPQNSVEYFKKWIKMSISMVLQPVILFAYLNVVLTAFDIVLYSGDHSVFRTIAGDAVDNPDFNIHQYMQDNQLITEKRPGPVQDNDQTLFDTGDPSSVSGLIKQYLFPTDQLDRALQTNKSNPSEIQLGPRIEPFDYEKAETVRSPPLEPNAESLLHETLGAMGTAFMVTFMFLLLLDYVPRIAHDLAGGVSEAPNIAGHGSNLPGMGQFSAGASNIVGNVEQGISGLVSRR